MRDLEAARARRWWRSARRIGSFERAAAFVDDVGFALLFPKARLALPSLWEAASDRPLSSLPQDWGPDIERVWRWKDELPKRRRAWYGRFLHGRPSFLSPALLAELYPRAGRPDDFREAGLGRDARRIAEVLLASGPTSSAVLRQAVGLDGKAGGARFSQALSELGRELVVTHFGAQDEGSGWPAAVLELSARAFRLRVPRGPDAARLAAAARFLDTMIAARPADLARAFGWTTSESRVVFEELERRGGADLQGALFVTRRAPRRSTRSATPRRRRSRPPRSRAPRSPRGPRSIS